MLNLEAVKKHVKEATDQFVVYGHVDPHLLARLFAENLPYLIDKVQALEDDTVTYLRWAATWKCRAVKAGWTEDDEAQGG